MSPSCITAWQIEGQKVEVVTDFLLLGSKIIANGDCSHEIRRPLLHGRKAMTNLGSVEKHRHYSASKDLYCQGYGLRSGHVRLWEMGLQKAEHLIIDAFKLWCWRRPESPLDSKEIKPVNLEGDQPWIFTGGSDAEPEAPVFWSSDVNRQFIGKVPDAGKDWGQKERRASEDEMAGLHHMTKYWSFNLSISLSSE